MRLGDAAAGLAAEQVEVVADQHGAEGVRLRLADAVAQRAVHADELDAVARLAAVDEIVVHDDLDASRELAGRGALGHLLDADALVVAVDRVAVLGLQRVSLLVLGRVGAAGGRAGAVHGRVAVLAVVELVRLLAVVDRLGHLGAHQRAARHDTFQRDHLAEVDRAQRSRVHVVVAETAAQADVVLLVLDLVLQRVVHLVHQPGERKVERGEKVVRRVEQARSVLAVVAPQVIEVDDQPSSVLAQHLGNLLAVVDRSRLCWRMGVRCELSLSSVWMPSSHSPHRQGTRRRCARGPSSGRPSRRGQQHRSPPSCRCEW